MSWMGRSLAAFEPLRQAFRTDTGARGDWWLQAVLWLHALAGWLIGGVAAAGVLGLFQRR